jgi:hypothetical protein
MHIAKSYIASLTIASAVITTCFCASFARSDAPAPTVDTTLDEVFKQERIPFDPTEWAKGPHFSDRSSMLASLVGSHSIIGLHKKTVHKLLGQASPAPIDDGLGIDYYTLSYRECGNVPFYDLEIRYENDRVVGLRVRTGGRDMTKHRDTNDCSNWIASKSDKP